MDSSNPKQVVDHGYDRIGASYEHWSSKAVDHARERYTKLLLEELPERAAVLDLGCGSSKNPGSIKTDCIKGVPMYFAGYPPEKNREIVEECGLNVVNARLETLLRRF